MNDVELKKLWQQQPLTDSAPSAEQLVSAMENKMTGFRRVLLSRDVGEVLACAAVIIIFGFFFYTAREIVSRIGDLIVIGSSIFIAFKLIYTRRSTPPSPSDATLVEALRAELKAVRAQSQLLGSVGWWYLLPLAIGILVCTWGGAVHRSDGLIFNIFYSVFVFGLFVYLYRLNQRARAKHILPLEAQLQSLLHSAETGEPLDKTRVANLRPIALSMAAASQAKPVEFKVAFWQIARWAEIGFIGIWFCLASASTDFRVQDAGSPRFHFNATNRETVVAEKIVDLINADNGALIEKLYGPEMRKAFPIGKTLDFYDHLAAGFGKIQRIDGPRTNGFHGWTAFTLHCQHGEMLMSLSLDPDDRIDGIYFQPVHLSKPLASAATINRRLFSWQHLVWLVGFFLGGLLFSWLLQMRTVRAVGISTLGIHLHQGLDLILWDEIKEVRTLRILNIRSLRLIQESGQKVIIPWTSLERSSELKAVVERTAPSAHPIRQYLSLLKRS